MGRRAPKYTLVEMEALRGEAGRESLDRIESDIQRASWKIRPLLERIRESLFDPDFDLSELLTPRGAGSGRTVDFHREMGETLGDYVDKERVATTARLLGRVVATAGAPKIEVHSLQLLKELREGRLSAIKARKLLDFFERLERDRSPEPREPSASARELAEEAWERIVQRGEEEQLLWVRDVLRFNRSAFFLLLGEKIQAEIAGEMSPTRLIRALWWTLLAMVHVEANAEEIGEEETRALRPLALEWLADVRRRAGPGKSSGLSERSTLRLQRLEAQLLRGVGQLAEAEQLFRQTRLELLRQYCTADAALASLDLALLLFERGGSSEIPGLASQAIPVLQAHPDRDDARSALRGLGEAIRSNSMTREVLVQARDCLARLCPSLLT